MTPLDNIFPERSPTARRIVAEVCEKTGVTPKEIFGARRGPHHISTARQLAQWRIYRETKMSKPTIGRLFGRDHTSVLNSIRRIDALMKEAK